MKRIHLIAAISMASLFFSCHGGKQKTDGQDTISTETTTDSQAIANTQTVNVDTRLTSIARFVAGKPIDAGDDLYEKSQSEAWQRYSQACMQAWQTYDSKVADSIRVWRDMELGNVSDSIKTVFYPFSGPDFINANLYFPNANEFILFGMEPPGDIPNPENIGAESLDVYLHSFSEAISSITQHSFFHTKRMKKQLASKELYGVTPILMLFMAQADKKIVNIRPFEFVNNGEKKYLDHFPRYKGEEAFGKGVEIQFTDWNQKELRTLTYFAANIADGGLSQNIPTREFLKTIPSPCVTYVKSATYLMNKSYFSIIRNTVLDKADLILQDDSGIRYKYFDPKIWDIQLYGSYDNPIALFKEHFDQALHDAYRTKKVKPLPFRRGYDAASNQLIARKHK